MKPESHVPTYQAEEMPSGKVNKMLARSSRDNFRGYAP